MVLTYIAPRLLVCYGTAFFAMLGIFGFHQTLNLAYTNVTSNEDLRGRWNGNRKNSE